MTFQQIKLSQLQCVLVLLLTLLNVETFAFSATLETNDCSDGYSFAEHLMLKGDYYRAITEFKRYIYHCPNGELIEHANENVGRSLLLAEQYSLVSDWYYDLTQEEQLRDRVALINSVALFRTEQYSRALGLLESTDLHELDSGEKAYSNYIKGLSSVHLEQWKNAKGFFMLVPSESPFNIRAEKYIDILMNTTSYPQKNSKVAGLLAIVPGLGYVYSGHYQTGIASLVVNSLLFWAAYDSFCDEKEAQGIIISIFSVGFYFGNVYGSIQSADRYNKYQYRQFHDRFVE